MKIRSDFVSNSSSCSFIIEDFERAAKVSAAFKDCMIPFDVADTVEVKLHAKNKNISKLFKLLELSFEASPIADAPEEISWDCGIISLGQLAEMHDKLSDIIPLVAYVEFESEDYGSGPMYLKMLYDFYNLNNCNPDTKYSEHDLISNDDMPFFSVLSKKVDV